MPVYNTREDLLRESIDSVLKQSFSDFEFIIVDDGSDETTKKILEDYSHLCTIYTQENKGISAARLTGIKNSIGDYIIFHDSDDIYDKDALVNISNIITNTNADLIIYYPPRFINQIGDIDKQNKFFTEGIKDKNEVVKQLCSLHINGIGDKCIKKTLFDGMKDAIDTTIINGEDLQQSAYVINKANTIYCTEKIIDNYRINIGHRSYYNPENINDINFLAPAYDIIFSLEENKKHLGTFKNYACNSVIYNSFIILNLQTINFKKKREYLNQINNLRIIEILKSINKKIDFKTSFLFNLLINKSYLNLFICSKIYKIVFGIDEI